MHFVDKRFLSQQIIEFQPVGYLTSDGPAGPVASRGLSGDSPRMGAMSRQRLKVMWVTGMRGNPALKGGEEVTAVTPWEN